MEFNFKLFGILLLAVLVAFVNSKPVENTALSTDEGEMMETAEGQNPFLPRFAMKKLKERREKARAQRRNGGQAAKPSMPSRPQHGVWCPQNPYRRYYKK